MLTLRGEQHPVDEHVRQIEITDTPTDTDDDRDQSLQRWIHDGLPLRMPSDYFVRVPGPNGPDTREAALLYGSLLDAVPGRLDRLCNIFGRLATDIIDHAGPECAGADLAGHQVRPVETEGGGGGENFALLLQRIIGVGFDVHALVRRKETGLRHPHFMGDRRLQEFDEGLCGRRILGDGDQRAGTQNGLAQILHDLEDMPRIIELKNSVILLCRRAIAEIEKLREENNKLNEALNKFNKATFMKNSDLNNLYGE